MNDVVEIRGLRCSAIVGVLTEERDREQPLSFDIDIERPFESAALNDDLTKTTNYAAIITLTCQIASVGHFLLLETLAYRVANDILTADGDITRVTVAVRKLRPPVPEDVATVGVRCTLER